MILSNENTWVKSGKLRKQLSGSGFRCVFEPEDQDQEERES